MSQKVILMATDPEFFTMKDGILSSVSGKLGCDKWNKRDYSDDIRIQEDNVLVEGDTNPQSTLSGFDSNIARLIKACEEVVNEVGHTLAPRVSSHIYTMDELNSYNKGVWEFGCEPDFNALTGAMNPKPAAADPGLRTAGGHVHFGFDDHLPKMGMDLDTAHCYMGVMCDYFLGLPSLLLDQDDRRRELYGKAGAIRKKTYGIEYRTLSNFWVFDEVNRRFIWDQGHKALDQLFDKAYERLLGTVGPAEIQRVINEADKRAAEKYIKLLGIA